MQVATCPVLIVAVILGIIYGGAIYIRLRQLDRRKKERLKDHHLVQKPDE